jgi:hypothetical protein
MRHIFFLKISPRAPLWLSAMLASHNAEKSNCPRLAKPKKIPQGKAKRDGWNGKNKSNE